MTCTCDWYENPENKYKEKMFSVNSVPYPLDEYRKLIGKPTTKDIAEVIKLWGIEKHDNQRVQSR